MNVKIVKMYPDVELPKYATDGSAGCDIRAHGYEMTSSYHGDGVIYSEYALQPHQTVIVHTGLKFEIPENHFLTICPRSGLACKRGVTLKNSPAVIDSDYRGELLIYLINNSNDTTILLGHDERVAQAILVPYVKMDFNEISEDELSTTDRFAGGFGSTGTS